MRRQQRGMAVGWGLATALAMVAVCLGPARWAAGQPGPIPVPVPIQQLPVAEEAAPDDPFAPGDDPGPGSNRLHKLGPNGLTQILDELLPDTAEPKKLAVPPETVQRLIEQLGDDSFRVRESATRQLRELGDGARTILLPATKHPNAEISWRVTRVLRSWEDRQYEEKHSFLPTFSSYCSGIRDEARLKELARRACLALDHGLWGESRPEILRHCLSTLIRSGRPEFDEQLKPYLKHKDLQVAMLVVEAAGQTVAWNPGEKTQPTLLLAGLQSERVEVVQSAMQYVDGNLRKEHKAEVKKALVQLFAGKNEDLRFQAAMVLMRSYKLPEASAHILAQAGGEDADRRHQALSVLVCDQPQRKPPDEKLLAALGPLLKHDDPNTRRMAAVALVSYSGEQVVRLVLPLLGDQEQYVANEVSQQLLGQRDRKMLRRLLEESVKEPAPPAKDAPPPAKDAPADGAAKPAEAQPAKPSAAQAAKDAKNQARREKQLKTHVKNMLEQLDELERLERDEKTNRGAVMNTLSRPGGTR